MTSLPLLVASKGEDIAIIQIGILADKSVTIISPLARFLSGSFVVSCGVQAAHCLIKFSQEMQIEVVLLTHVRTYACS